MSTYYAACSAQELRNCSIKLEPSQLLCCVDGCTNPLRVVLRSGRPAQFLDKLRTHASLYLRFRNENPARASSSDSSAGAASSASSVNCTHVCEKCRNESCDGGNTQPQGSDPMPGPVIKKPVHVVLPAPGQTNQLAAAAALCFVYLCMI